MKHWIQAARLKTLPLSLSGPLLAGSIALFNQQAMNVVSLILCLLVAVLLQIISNYANDLGDFLKGTDQAANRTDRALTAGTITEKDMKWAIAYLSLITFIAGVCLIILEIHNLRDATILFAFGLLAILAAITYTLGKRAYGYLGLGDIFVFVFFGIFSVLGTYYTLTKTISILSVYAALSVGFLAAAVLHINNLRDLEKDKAHHKKTLATKLGFANGRIYHIVIVGLGCAFIIPFILQFGTMAVGLNLVLFIVILSKFLDLKQSDFQQFNEQLKLTSLNTFAMVLIIFFYALFL